MNHSYTPYSPHSRNCSAGQRGERSNSGAISASRAQSAASAGSSGEVIFAAAMMFNIGAAPAGFHARGHSCRILRRPTASRNCRHRDQQHHERHRFRHVGGRSSGGTSAKLFTEVAAPDIEVRQEGRTTGRALCATPRSPPASTTALSLKSPGNCSKSVTVDGKVVIVTSR